MTLPRSFKSWAVVGGKVVRISVDVKDGGVADVDLPDTGCADCLPPEEQQAARAWAVEALAWLKAESEKAGPEDLYIRSVANHFATLRNALGAIANLGDKPSNLSRQAERDWRGLHEGMDARLRAAHMEDLLDRCAEEMRRQAEEVVKKSACTCVGSSLHDYFHPDTHAAGCARVRTQTNFCTECLGPVVGSSVHPHCAAEKVKP